MLALTCFSMMTFIFGTFNLSGLFIVPITEELGLSRGIFSLHLTCSMASSIILNLNLSRILEGLRRKTMFIIACLVCIVVFCGYGMATKLWHFFALSFCMGFVSPILTSTGTSVLINENISAGIRGKIMGVVMAGSGFGTMILSPILTQIILHQGWRFAYYAGGALVLVLVLPLIILFVGDPKPEIEEVPKEEETPVEALDRVDYPQPTGIGFYVIVTIGMISLVSGVLHSQMMPYSIELEIDETIASFMISLYAGFLVVGKIALGALCDRIGTRAGFNLTLVVLLASQVAAVFSKVMTGLYIPAIELYGIGNTTSTVGIVLYLTALYGQENYNKVVGKYMAAMSIFGVAGPLVGSFSYDWTGSYVSAFAFCAVLCVFILVCSITSFHKVSRQRAEYLTEHPEVVPREKGAEG